jgi:hypothetical protein
MATTTATDSGGFKAELVPIDLSPADRVLLLWDLHPEAQASRAAHARSMREYGAEH